MCRREKSRRSPVKRAHGSAHACVEVDVVDDFVQVVHPVVGVLVLEIGPTRPHLVVALGDVVLLERCCDERVDHLVHVVVVALGVVLERHPTIPRNVGSVPAGMIKLLGISDCDTTLENVSWCDDHDKCMDVYNSTGVLSN